MHTQPTKPQTTCVASKEDTHTRIVAEAREHHKCAGALDPLLGLASVLWSVGMGE